MRFYFNYGMTWRFAEIIKNSGLTDEEAAEKLGCSKGQISMLISGERKYHSEWVRRISEAWGIPEWQLFADPKDVIPQNYRDLMEGYLALDDDRRRMVDDAILAAKYREEKKTDPPQNGLPNGNAHPTSRKRVKR